MSFLMENFYMEATEEDKELDIISEEAAIDMMKINHMLNMVNQQYEINIRQAELKVVRESGTSEDLVALYEAVEAETSEKKRGIIGTAFLKIANFFQKISEFIKSKILKMTLPKDAKVTVRSTDEEAYDTINKANGKISEGINKLQAGNIAAIAGIGTAIVGIIGATALAIYGNDDELKEARKNETDKKISLPAATVMAWANGLDKISTNLSNQLSKLKGNGSSEPTGDGDGKESGFQKFLNAISKVAEIVKNFSSSLFKSLLNIKNKPDNEETGETEEKNDNKKTGETEEKNDDEETGETESTDDTESNGEYTLESALGEIGAILAAM